MMINTLNSIEASARRGARALEGRERVTLDRSIEPAPSVAAQAGPRVEFSDVLSEAIDGIRTAFKESGEASEAALLGRGTPHQAMVAMSKAGLVFSFATQTRNKMVDAYREMMSLQV
mgnify:CR=1 FL=1